jgi:C1A family cysteine protease
LNNRKKIIAGIVVLVLVVLVSKYIRSITNPSYQKSGVNMAVASGWNSIIAAEINRQEIFLTVDGKPVRLADKDLVMGDSRDILINVEVLRDVFFCVVNVVDNHKFYIEKGNTQVIINTEDNSLVVNEVGMHTGETIINREGKLYVPVTLLENYFSYKFTWDYKTNTVFMTNKKQDEKIYPYAYDYRKIKRIVRVNDQAELGTCWAFASLTALETTFMPENVYDFSEDHMSLNDSYDINQYEGGKYYMSMAYLLSWKGPVYEKEDPYGDGFSPDGLKSAFHVQEIQIIPSKDLEGIKKAIFLYGGVQSSLYMPMGYTYEESSPYYNVEHSAYYHIGNEKANHDVVIVGWDDSYPATNFSTPPEGDGAFICVNSWGEEFGEEGFFYVSYYDSGIGVHNMVYTSVEDKNNYDNIYQIDLCGWVGQL